MSRKGYTQETATGHGLWTFHHSNGYPSEKVYIQNRETAYGHRCTEQEGINESMRRGCAFFSIVRFNTAQDAFSSNTQGKKGKKEVRRRK